jgi:SAM-dependent methyltransferase
MSPYSDYLPYSEGEDNFEEFLKGVSTQLHIKPSSGHLRFLPVPSEEALGEYYNGTFIRSLEPPTPQKEFTPAVLDVAKGVRSHMQSLAPFPDNFVAHDIGCGFGALVHAFQQLGIQASGNEQNKDWINAANPYCGFRLTAEPLSIALKALSLPVDLFTILHVLEHLPDPQATLSTAAEYLSDKGLIYICVPNAHSFRALMDGRRKDPCYMFPQHLNYFTPLSLITMLADVGLEVVEMNTRPLSETDMTGCNRIHSALGMRSEEQIDANAWLNAQCANLLGGELYVLATSKTNLHSKRDLEAGAKAQRAFQNFNTARAQRSFEQVSAKYLHEIRSSLFSIAHSQARQLKLIQEWNQLPWYKRAFLKMPIAS